MCSVGLSLIFGTTGLTNFAHGEMVTFGGMTAFLLNVTGIGFLGFLGFLPLIDDDGRFQLFLAVPIAVVARRWVRMAVRLGHLRSAAPARHRADHADGRHRRPVDHVAQHLPVPVQGRTRPLRDYSLQEGTDIGPITITPRDLITAAISLVVLVAVALALQKTRLGKATRAVSRQPRSRLGDGHQQPAGDPDGLGPRRRAGRARRHLPRPRRAGRVRHGIPPAVPDVRRHHARWPRLGVRRPGRRVRRRRARRARHAGRADAS